MKKVGYLVAKTIIINISSGFQVPHFSNVASFLFDVNNYSLLKFYYSTITL
jgi:hypothetical protein